MKSKNPFFSAAVLKKDMTRYAPVWGIYSAVLLIYAFSIMADTDQAGFARKMCTAMNTMSIPNLCYGGICAMMLFSDLFKPRLCYALHALPIRREGWLLTHAAAGLLFSLVPNIYIAAICGVFLRQHFYIALIWLAAATLQYIFFFSVGIFCAVCAGNRLGMAAIYCVLNFAPLLLAALTERLYVPALYGITVDTHWLSYVWPMGGFSEFDYVTYSYDTSAHSWTWEGFVPGGWSYLAAALAVGIGLAALSVWIYRKRELEHAGNLISLKALEPVFLALYALGVGVILELLLKNTRSVENFTGLYAGLVIGFFTGRMLFARKLNVFSRKELIGAAALLGSVALSIFLVRIDAFGIVRYVPDAEDVEYVCVEESPGYSHYGQPGFILDSYDIHYDTLQAPLLRDAEQISQVCKLHRESVNTPYARDPDNSETVYKNVYITYALKNGLTVKRTCQVDISGGSGQWLEQYCSSWEYLFQWDDVDTFQQWMIYANATDLRSDGSWATKGLALGPTGHNTRPPSHGYAYATRTDYLYGLVDAIKADCDAGNMAQSYDFHSNEEPVYLLNLTWQTDHDPSQPWMLASSVRLSLDVYPSCENTIAYIEQLREELENSKSIFLP